MSAFFANAQQRPGVTLRLGEGIACFYGESGRVTTAISTTGERYPADLVVVGIGVVPRTGVRLRARGGQRHHRLRCLRTSAWDIYAMGDCASFPNTRSGTHRRLRSVQNATDKGPPRRPGHARHRLRRLRRPAVVLVQPGPARCGCR